jgi:hypothetical protein
VVNGADEEWPVESRILELLHVKWLEVEMLCEKVAEDDAHEVLRELVETKPVGGKLDIVLLYATEVPVG